MTASDWEPAAHGKEMLRSSVKFDMSLHGCVSGTMCMLIDEILYDTE